MAINKEFPTISINGFNVPIIQPDTDKFIFQGGTVGAIRSQLYNFNTEETDIPIKPSYLGTPVFTNLNFKKGSFEPLDGSDPIGYEGLEIDTVLMTVAQSKNIITTPLVGASGTVKEYIALGDYVIQVSGLIVSPEKNVYPTEDVDALVNLFTVPDSLRVTSDFLNRFSDITPEGISGIDEVVVLDYELPQAEGSRNVQPFVCTLLSDSPIELII